MKHFRPINLCNSSYKIISKVLVGRLKGILGDLVGTYQNVFIPERHMSDNCLISHEIINWVKKRKKGNSFASILKIDLSKAYDRIHWDFVEAILLKMNFPAMWINWIMQCIKIVSYSILVNGEPTHCFSPIARLDRETLSLHTSSFYACKYYHRTLPNFNPRKSSKV